MWPINVLFIIYLVFQVTVANFYIQYWHGCFTDTSWNPDMHTLGLAGFYRYMIYYSRQFKKLNNFRFDAIYFKSLLESKWEVLGKFPIIPLNFQDPESKVWGGTSLPST